jgi:quercetin dioxygenase-like cupin family protein
MRITRSSIETMAGPKAWFTGAVYVDAVAGPSPGSRLSSSSVHFAPGTRTAWHTHPNGQTIYVTEGVGLVQRRGGPIERSTQEIASSLSRTRITGTAPPPPAP